MGLLLLPGCLEPFRAHVDPLVLTQELAWTSTDGTDSEGGFSGPNSVETEYTFRSGTGPPYPAILQVFSIRDLGRRTTKELLDLTHQLVDNGTKSEGIRADPSGAREGTRTLQNGLETHWFSQEGTVASTGPLFTQQNVRVLIIGEVGYDGRSSTSVIAVGIAQVRSSQCTPIVVTCQSREDLTSWKSMVGDDEGTVRGAVSKYGLIDHLVTHD